MNKVPFLLAFSFAFLWGWATDHCQAEVMAARPGEILQTEPPNRPAYKAPSSPSGRLPAVTDDAVVNAVVVRSWGGCDSSELIWDALNANWSQFGPVPIAIDYTFPGLCDGPITYDALVASGADVLIISDPAGGGDQYSLDEVRAIAQYAQEGHNIVGSFLVFYDTVGGKTDNRALAPLFGLKQNVRYTTSNLTPAFYNLFRPGLPLFRGLPNPYVSTGYPDAQMPVDGVWSRNESIGGRHLAKNDEGTHTILVYCTESYIATYIASMPEYNGGVDDQQFYYNALTRRAELACR